MSNAANGYKIRIQKRIFDLSRESHQSLFQQNVTSKSLIGTGLRKNERRGMEASVADTSREFGIKGSKHGV